MIFKVKVRKYLWSDKTFFVEADDRKEAKEIAINEAKNVEYSCESGYDYEVLENLEMGEMNIIRKKK